MKKLLGLFMIVGLIFSCSNMKKNQPTDSTNDEKAVELTVGNFKEKAAELVGKLVSIQGTADHICSHDGKKLFLIDVEMPGRVKVVTGDDLAAFNSEYEGYDFNIDGYIAEDIVDENYLQNWEEELKSDTEVEKKHLDGEHSHGHNDGDEDHSKSEAFEQISKYRTMMADQGVDHLSFYHIVAIRYKIIED